MVGYGGLARDYRRRALIYEPSVGLLNDPGKFRTDGLYRLADLDQVVRVHACPNQSFNHGVSQFAPTSSVGTA